MKIAVWMFAHSEEHKDTLTAETWDQAEEYVLRFCTELVKRAHGTWFSCSNQHLGKMEIGLF